MKVLFLLFCLSITSIVKSQSKSEFTVIEKKLNEKKGEYSTVTIRVFDEDNKRIFPILRIDKVGFFQADTTSTASVYLSKGRHKIQAGWVGYYYSSVLKIKIDLNKDYEIQVFLKPMTEPLE
ncbi:MAG: hypothetical protein K2X26_11115 [Chitinophagaceae bacterium]|nr:hypothetical protein [Chitinophagaceae bacterium]